MCVAEVYIGLAIDAVLVLDDDLLNLLPKVLVCVPSLGKVIDDILEAAILQMLIFESSQGPSDGVPQLRLLGIGEAKLRDTPADRFRDDVDS